MRLRVERQVVVVDVVVVVAKSGKIAINVNI